MLTTDHIKLSETNLQGAKSTVNMQIISKDREDNFGNFGNVCPTNVDRRRWVTLSKNENEWQKNDRVPILLSRAASTLFDAKKIEKKNSLTWTLELIQ